MTKALKAMIDRLVKNHAKEMANMIDKVKHHSQEYKIIKKSNKGLIDKIIGYKKKSRKSKIYSILLKRYKMIPNRRIMI